MKLIYLAHPVRGDVSQNLANARRWVKWIEDTEPNCAVVANWIVECEIYDDGNIEHRARGIERNLAVLQRCDELWLCGVEVSEGMQVEKAHAAAHGLRVYSVLGHELPPNTGGA